MKFTSSSIGGAVRTARWPGLWSMAVAVALLGAGSAYAGSIDPGTSGDSSRPNADSTKSVSTPKNDADLARQKNGDTESAAPTSRQPQDFASGLANDLDAGSDLLAHATYQSSSPGSTQFPLGKLSNASLPAGLSLNTWGDVGRQFNIDFGHVIPLVHSSTRPPTALDMSAVPSFAGGTGDVFGNSSSFLGPRTFASLDHHSKSPTHHHVDKADDGEPAPFTPAPVPLPATFWAAGLLLAGFVAFRVLRGRSLTPQPV